MTEATFNSCMDLIEAAGVRTFRRGHRQVLFNRLKDTDEFTFQNLTEDLLKLEEHPRNLLRWYVMRIYEINHLDIKNRQIVEGKAWDNYTPEQFKLFINCTETAMHSFPTKNFTESRDSGPSDYYRWMEIFENGILMRTGVELTEYLKGVLSGLKNESVKKPVLEEW